MSLYYFRDNSVKFCLQMAMIGKVLTVFEPVTLSKLEYGNNDRKNLTKLLTRCFYDHVVCVYYLCFGHV